MLDREYTFIRKIINDNKEQQAFKNKARHLAFGCFPR
jgi:hypothetical protein